MSQPHRAKARSLIISGASGNELFCLGEKGLRPGPLVVGNSVQSLGYFGSMGMSARQALGGESSGITQAINEGRLRAVERMREEAAQHGAVGVGGVGSSLRPFAKNIEFVSTGSAILADGAGRSDPFTSSLDGRGLFCAIDADYRPKRFVFGNIAYSVGAARNWLGRMKTYFNGEIAEFSDAMNKTRRAALERMEQEAYKAGANAVVGVDVEVMPFYGFHEMFMFGTAAKHPALPANRVASCELSADELWSAAKMGYAPVRVVMATSVYSLGALGGWVAAVKSMASGEVTALTRLVYDARESALDMLEEDARACGAEIVLGADVRIQDLGNGLVEFMALGSGMRRVDAMKTSSEALPAQAVAIHFPSFHFHG